MKAFECAIVAKNKSISPRTRIREVRPNARAHAKHAKAREAKKLADEHTHTHTHKGHKPHEPTAVKNKFKKDTFSVKGLALEKQQEDPQTRGFVA